MRFIAALLAALWLGLAAAQPAAGQDASQAAAVERQVETLRADLQRLRDAAANPGASDDQFSEVRRTLETIKLNATKAGADLASPIANLSQQLARLGAPPAAGQVEAPAIASQRNQLNQLLARLSAAQKQTDLIATEADQLAGAVSAQQRDRFFQRIFNPGKSIFDPGLWADTAEGVSVFNTRVGSLISNWWQSQRDGARLTGLLLLPAALMLLVGLGGLLRRVVRRFFPPGWGGADGQVTALDRLWRAASITVWLVLGSVLLWILVYTTLALSELLTPRFEILVDAALRTLFSVMTTAGFGWLLAAPGRPDWRLIAVDERSARSLPVLLGATSLVNAGSTSLRDVSDALFMPVNQTIGISALAALVLIVLMSATLLLIRREAAEGPVGGADRYILTGFVRFLPLIWLALGVAAAALMLGYVALAYFIAGQTFRTTLVLSFLALIHHLVDAASAALTDRTTALGRALRRVSSMGERAIERLGLAVRTIFDVVLVALGVPWLLAIWTVTWIDLSSLLTRVALGFKVGSITISPGSIVLMLATLAAVVVLTRLFTRWLDRRVLADMRLNKGVQDSIHTGANYLGYVVAAAIALSVMGIDLSNIAIVAGALGVGIGFGLQSIVNNFVSGLILLAERPIRVGDWVVTAAGEGIVRKINVRSTEIETFDACSIIVPNSDLITEPVKNWMHRSTNGRFTVPVTVSYGSDAHAVAEVLLAEARRNPGIADVPPPVVQLTRFGPQGLEFEVKAYVSHVFDGPQVASDLRLAILDTFAKKQITIPAAPAAPAAKPAKRKS